MKTIKVYKRGGKPQTYRLVGYRRGRAVAWSGNYYHLAQVEEAARVWLAGEYFSKVVIKQNK